MFPFELRIHPEMPEFTIRGRSPASKMKYFSKL